LPGSRAQHLRTGIGSVDGSQITRHDRKIASHDRKIASHDRKIAYS
jgi:hypothetical protein